MSNEANPKHLKLGKHMRTIDINTDSPHEATWREWAMSPEGIEAKKLVGELTWSAERLAEKAGAVSSDEDLLCSPMGGNLPPATMWGIRQEILGLAGDVLLQHCVEHSGDLSIPEARGLRHLARALRQLEPGDRIVVHVEEK